MLFCCPRRKARTFIRKASRSASWSSCCDGSIGVSGGWIGGKQLCISSWWNTSPSQKLSALKSRQAGRTSDVWIVWCRFMCIHSPFARSETSIWVCLNVWFVYYEFQSFASTKQEYFEGCASAKNILSHTHTLQLQKKPFIERHSQYMKTLSNFLMSSYEPTNSPKDSNSIWPNKLKCKTMMCFHLVYLYHSISIISRNIISFVEPQNTAVLLLLVTPQKQTTAPYHGSRHLERLHATLPKAQ